MSVPPTSPSDPITSEEVTANLASADVVIMGGGTPSSIELAALAAAVEQAVGGRPTTDVATGHTAAGWRARQWTRTSWAQSARAQASDLAY
ncbi:MAG: hypothetical protein WD576_05190 [Nitriliruptoraceae bacterium]